MSARSMERPPAPIDRVKAHFEMEDAQPDSRGFYPPVCCPAHNDTKPSLIFWETSTGGIGVKCRAGCSPEAVKNALKLDLRSANGYKPAYRPQTASVSLIELAEEKKLDWQMLFNWGVTGEYKLPPEWRRKYNAGLDCIRISYRDRSGDEITKIRIRTGLTGHDGCWISETPGDISAYGEWKLGEAESAGYLYLVEGESDVWTLWSYGLPALGVPGADMVKCLNGQALATIPRIFIFQEPDQAKKAASITSAGQGFYIRASQQLRKTGYTGELSQVRFEKLTGHKDPNELHQALYLKHKDIDHFKPVIAKALELAEPANDAVEQNQTALAALDQAINAQDIDSMYKAVFALGALDTNDPASVALEESYIRKIKATFGKDATPDKVANLVRVKQIIATERKRIAGAQKQETADLDTVAELFAEQHSDVWSYDILGQTWRKWTGTHWSEPASEEDGKTELDKIIVHLLHELEFEVKSNGTLDCVHRLAKGKCKRLFMTRAKAVNFANGTLDLNTKELQAHCKEDNFLYCLEYPYDDTGDYPHTRAALESILCVEQILPNGTKVYVPDHHAIQALMTQEGLALIRDTKLHNSISLYGAKRAGKSTLMRHGNSVCGNVTLGHADPTDKYSSFAGDDLFSSELEGKRTRFIFGKQTLVCADEIRPEAIRDNEGIVKDMMAHSGVPMRGIGKDDMKDNVWRAKLIMSVNEIPHYRDTSGAIAERIIYLHTPLTRQKEGALKRDLNLLEKMIIENGAYARDCIRLAQAALERSYIPMSSYMKQLSKVAETNGNALKAFVEEKCVLDPGKITHTDVIYQAFLAFREESGHDKRYAKPTLTMALREMNIGVTSSTNAIMIDGEQKRALYGIRLKAEGELMLPAEGKQEKNDPLLLPALWGLTQVDDLTTPFLDRQPGHQPIEPACKATSLTQVDDLTTENEKVSIRERYILPEKEAQIYIYPPTGTNDGENRVKSSTSPLNQPVEPSEVLTFPVNRSSTRVNQVVNPRQVKPLREF